MDKQQKKYNRAKKKIDSIESKYPDLEVLKSNYNRFNFERKNLLRYVSPEEYASLKQSYNDYQIYIRNKKIIKNYVITPPPLEINKSFESPILHCTEINEEEEDCAVNNRKQQRDSTSTSCSITSPSASASCSCCV